MITGFALGSLRPVAYSRREAMGQKEVIYELKLIGGPFDGTPNLQWRMSGEWPVPDTVLVGRCPGNGDCASDPHLCAQLGHGKPHTAYWLPDEDDRPEETTTYELFRSWVYGDVPMYGTAQYLIPGLHLPSGRGAADKVPVPA